MKALPSTSYLIPRHRAVCSFRLGLAEVPVSVLLTWALERVGQIPRLCNLSQQMYGVLWYCTSPIYRACLAHPRGNLVS